MDAICQQVIELNALYNMPEVMIVDNDVFDPLSKTNVTAVVEKEVALGEKDQDRVSWDSEESEKSL